MVLKFQIKESSVGGGGLRSFTSQLLASMSSNLALLDLLMAVNFATIAVPELLNASEGLSLNKEQASWFGSTAFLCQPFGALLSGPMVDYFGRKKGNFLANIPHLAAWILMYFSWNLPSLFIANGLLGLGTGIMEAPIVSYLGEICHPSLRGSLSMFNQAFGSAGMFIMYFLGTVVNWRQAALICLIIPVCSMVVALMAPNTPVWLLSRGQEKEALKALCFLRGWTTKENVKKEFDELVHYTKSLPKCDMCFRSNSQNSLECEHARMNILNRYLLKFRYVMLCKETLRPLSYIFIYFILFNMTGLMPAKPNLENVCRAFGMPGNAKNIVLMVGVVSFTSSVIQIVMIRILKKRKIVMSSIIGMTSTAIGLSIYAKLNLNEAVFSYDTTTFPKETSYTPLVLLYLMTLFHGLMLPWILLGEVFPFRSRASAQGISAALNYVITFIATKTFINVETSVHLWGAYAIYGAFGFIGIIYLYFFTPETEGKTLEEIESYYSGDLRFFADDPFINLFKKSKSNIHSVTGL